MATVLVIAAAALQAPPGRARLFAIGFEATGALILTALMILLRRFEDAALDGFVRLARPVVEVVEAVLPDRSLIGWAPFSPNELIAIPLFIGLTRPPQLLLALAGGYILARRTSIR